MQIIRCTQKLQKEIGLTKKDLVDIESDDSLLGSWFANLIFIDRKKCVVFVNEKTLFNFIICDLSRAQIRQLDKFFLANLECVLADEGIPKDIKAKIIANHQEIAYAKTNNRSVLGSMNEICFLYKFFILDAGGVHSYMIPEIIRKINGTLFGSKDYKYPIDSLKKLIKIY